MELLGCGVPIVLRPPANHLLIVAGMVSGIPNRDAGWGIATGSNASLKKRISVPLFGKRLPA